MLVLVAREAGSVRVAARSTDRVAADAELLARASVAARAGHGVDPRLGAMLPVRPAGRVRAARRHSGHVLAGVAIDAGALAVAGRADSGVGARLVGVASQEAGAMQPGEAHVTQGQLPRQRGHGSLAVARGALAIGVAARTEIARARGSNAVLADEVSVVNEVVVGRHPLVSKIDVATVAVAQGPLVAVLVAPEAARHRRQDRLRTSLGHLGMAADAIAADRDHMGRVLEAKLRPGELRRLPYVRLAVAAGARPLVVGLLVAAPADRVGREMQRSRLPRGRDIRMALDAVDALENVRAVLERVGRGVLAQAASTRAKSMTSVRRALIGTPCTNRRPWGSGTGRRAQP